MLVLPVLGRHRWRISGSMLAWAIIQQDIVSRSQNKGEKRMQDEDWQLGDKENLNALK
jgi:hypothetical protein